MNWFEIGLAFASNLRAVFIIIALLTGLIGCIRVFEYRKQSHLLFIVTFVLSILACIPDVHELWQVRISLIKLQMASPENVQGGVEAIERVGRELECKYLRNDCVSALEKKSE